MLTQYEMFQVIRHLWYSMARSEVCNKDFPVYFERPQNGKGYHGGGEFYIYTVGTRYHFSYSELGTEDEIAASNDFQDIAFEIALIMSGDLASEALRKQRKREANRLRCFLTKPPAEEGLKKEEVIAKQMELIKKADEVFYQRALENYEKYQTLRMY